MRVFFICKNIFVYFQTLPVQQKEVTEKNGAKNNRSEKNESGLSMSQTKTLDLPGLKKEFASYNKFTDKMRH